jgi:hypothetical protein
MKFKYILTTAIALGIYHYTIGQDNGNTSTNNEGFANAGSVSSEDTLSGMDNSIVNTPITANSAGTCTLIKNNYTDRKITHSKNGYKIVTAGKSEIVKVHKGKNGARKIKYTGETEDLKYHKTSDGKIHYKYKYNEDCREILVKRNKKGITTTNHKSSLNWEEINAKVTAAINRGIDTCSITD